MLVRKFGSRGAHGVVEAHGEVLFAEGTDLSRWKNRFSNRITHFTRQAAPTNKRPRWGHYGKPLKTTISSATRTRITKGGGFYYIAVGSTAPHALYVDQGTGVYGGNGPYEAAILPPWYRGSPSLYESTWRPAGPGQRRVRPVMIKGQRPQNFFDKGLEYGFRSMQMRSEQIPGEGVSGMSGALGAITSLADQVTKPSGASGTFKASLEQWRLWRDEAWQAYEPIGRERTARARSNKQYNLGAARKARKIRDREKISKQYVDERTEAQKKKLRDEKARKKEGRRIRREKEAALRLNTAKIRTRQLATAFALQVKGRGGTIIGGGWGEDANGRLFFKVSFATKRGKIRTRLFQVRVED